MKCFKKIILAVMLLTAMPVWAADITLNFKNADIRAFIDFVAGFSGKNFLVDNRVKGTVSIVSPTAVDEVEAYNIFLSVLEVNGFATVDAGSVIKIVPRAEGKQKSVPVHVGNAKNNDTMVTQVLRLKYANSQQLVALIRPLISPNSHLVAYPRGNMLLLTDSSSNILRIQQVLKLLDRKDAVGVRIFTLKYASAGKLASTLAKLYPPAPNSALGMKVIAHQPGNMLVVVGAPQVVNEVASVIEKLDISPESDSDRLQVRYLKYAKAKGIESVLTSIMGAKAAPGKSLFAGDVKVVADETTNALLITADPSDIDAVGRIIDKLDVRRRQVLIEALIVEVSGNSIQRFGVEWMASGGAGAGVQSFQNIKPVGAGLSTNAALATPGSVSTVLTATAPTGLTLGVVNKALSIGALVHALESDNDANVLSTPNLLTLDNEEAEIVVGQNVPFITGSSASTGAANPNPFQTIERKDIGLTLRVKPQISGDDSVTLDIFQEISSIDTKAGVQGSDLITTKRSIKTKVLANDGQMIVLGGLMRDDETAKVQRVPCIGSIPVLGEPFKFSENTKTKTNLMVFLKPHIIKSSSYLESITNRKYNNIKKLYEHTIEGGTILFPKEQKYMPETLKPREKK